MFGEQTRRTVSEYQRRFSLPETGIVDERTWNSIGKTYSNLISEINVAQEQFGGNTLREGDSDFNG